ncbi:hypothetical protein PC116_g34877 [Phytophthora cactorum]|nr:hypothetical protein PC116_g34877 [Phytophthora cactorum]
MQFSTLAFLASAIIGAPLALVNAGPVPASSLEPRVFYSYCCIPGCVYCQAKDCSVEACGSVFSTCCAESFRKVAEDGNSQVFNANGQVMEFVDPEAFNATAVASN